MGVYFIIIVIIHFIADFIFQDEYWATNKKNAFIKGEWKPLLKHTGTYAVIWFLMLWFPFPFITSLSFALITFVTHTATDYFTAPWVGKLFKEGKYGSSIPNFGAFTVIGLDQVLHYTQLVLTWTWLIGF